MRSLMKNMSFLGGEASWVMNALFPDQQIEEEKVFLKFDSHQPLPKMWYIGI